MCSSLHFWVSLQDYICRQYFRENTEKKDIIERVYTYLNFLFQTDLNFKTKLHPVSSFCARWVNELEQETQYPEEVPLHDRKTRFTIYVTWI